MLVLEHNGEQLPLNIDDRNWYIVHKYDGKDELHFEMDSAHEMRPLLAEQAAVRTMSDEQRNCNRFLIKSIDEHSNFVVVDCDLDLTAWTDAHIHRIGSPVHEYEDAKLCYEEMAGVLGIADVLADAIEEDINTSLAAQSEKVILRGYTKTLLVSTRKSNDRMMEAIDDVTISAELSNSLAQKSAATEEAALDDAEMLKNSAEALADKMQLDLTEYNNAYALQNELVSIQSDIEDAQPSMLALRNHLQSITEITLTQALLNVRPTGAECATWGLSIMPQVDPTAKHALLAENGQLLTNMTPLSLLDRIAEIWGLVVNYNVVGHSVLILDPALAGDSGDLYMKDLNVSKIEYTGNSRDLITCMYGYGKRDPETGENLTFESVNQGLPYVENHAYSNKRIVGVFEDVGIDDPTDLYNATYAKLLEVCNPVQNFDIGVNEIGAGAAMYKTAMVTMPTGVRVKHMIVEWKEYPDAEDLSTITLNKVAPSMTEEWKKIKKDDGILIEDINSDVTEDYEVGDRNNDDGILIAKDSEGEVYHRVDKDGVTTGDKSTDKDGNVQKGNTAGNHYTAVYNGAVNKEEMTIGDKVNDLKADIDIYGDINVEGSITLNGQALPGGGGSDDLCVKYKETQKTYRSQKYKAYEVGIGRKHTAGLNPTNLGYHINKHIEHDGYHADEVVNTYNSSGGYDAKDQFMDGVLKVRVPLLTGQGVWVGLNDHGQTEGDPDFHLLERSSLPSYTDPTGLGYWRVFVELAPGGGGAPRLVMISPTGTAYRTAALEPY